MMSTSARAVEKQPPSVAGEETSPELGSVFRPDTRFQDYQGEAGLWHWDRMLRASLARITAGVSPVALARAYVDWAGNLALSPGKQAELVGNGLRQATRFWLNVARSGAAQPTEVLIEPMANDKRFRDAGWNEPPFKLYKEGFLLVQQWWHNATTGVPGVSAHHEAVVAFIARQLLDAWAPSNFLATNPELQRVTQEEGGQNLARGLVHLAEDWEQRVLARTPRRSERFRPGRDVAVTPGQVVFRNHLIELIQYLPQTEQVYPEPVLIVPAWIMKYYILDLSPNNSLIEYLVENGHTVFAISWRNPGPEDRELTIEDYRQSGVMDALTVVSSIVPNARVHAVGYCLGGTMLAIAAAAMARDGRDDLASMTLIAAQTDFSEPGELALYIDSSQVDYLDSLMWSQGYLDAGQMAGAFTLLRSNDLLWSRMVHDYFLGRRDDKNDLMAWNADATRMPYKMHSQYLRWLFHENRLARGKYIVNDRPVALSDIKVPIFTIGTAKDHVAPWRSVYKIQMLTDTDVTFLLTSGGHNSGIVTPPGHPRRIYQVATLDGRHFTDPDRWRIETPVLKGSWWPCFERWLADRSHAPVVPPPMGRPESGYPVLGPAPGIYVHQA
jgi:polyhydroxyalkanoate synthase